MLLLDRQPYSISNENELIRKLQAFMQEVKGGQKGVNVRIKGHSSDSCIPSAGSSMKRTPVKRGKTRKKRLDVTTRATSYQKEWFKGLRERVEQGEPLAIVNADVPQEIFRAMDIPYVVNQWWSSVCAAKQLSPYYLGLLNERGYRQDLCRYCSLSLASAFDPAPEEGPWGGLPRPALAVTRLSCDSQAKIFELWSKKFDVPFIRWKTRSRQKFRINGGRRHRVNGKICLNPIDWIWWLRIIKD